MSTGTKDYLYKEDIGWGQGTATRQTSTGTILTLTKIPNIWNIINVEDYGTAKTDATITLALNDIGAVDKRTLIFNSGSWTISNNIQITDNISVISPAGALFSVANTKTFTISGYFDAPFGIQVFGGLGTTNLSDYNANHLSPEWWGATTPYTTITTATATPDFRHSNMIVLSYSGAQAITSPTGFNGQIVRIMATNANATMAASATLLLSAAWNPGANDTLTLMNIEDKWYELSRSNN